jgi:hypothetical protein
MTYLPQLHQLLVEGAQQIEDAEAAAPVNGAASAASGEGRIAGAVRRFRKRRLFIVVVLALVAAGSAAAATGVFSGTPSAPPSGRLGTDGANPLAATGYRIAVTPNLDGGAVGWCVQAVLLYRQGTSTGGGCDGVQLRDKPIIAAGGGFSADGGRAGYAVTTDLYFMTSRQVAAIRVSPTLTIRTLADNQLPNGYRIAIAIHQSRSHSAQPTEPNPFNAIPLAASGKPLAMHWPGYHESPKLHRAAVLALSDQAAYWQTNPTHGVGPQPKTHHAPPGACEIDTQPLADAKLFYGEVVQHIRAIPQLTGRTYLTCASTEFGYRGHGYVSAILLDAQNPGRKPELLPDSQAAAGDPTAANEPNTQSGPAQPITGQRVGNAWLVVESSAPLMDRLRVLHDLTTCIHLTGPPCAEPPNP